MDIFVSCESYDYSKIDDLSLLKLGKFYCENKMNLPSNIKLIVKENKAYYVNLNKMLLSPKIIKSSKYFNHETKANFIVSEIVQKNFRRAHQFLLKNYDNLVQYSIYFNKYLINKISSSIKRFIHILSQIVFYKFSQLEMNIQNQVKSSLYFTVGMLNFLKNFEKLDKNKFIRIFMWILELLSNLLLRMKDKFTNTKDKTLINGLLISLQPHEVLL